MGLARLWRGADAYTAICTTLTFFIVNLEDYIMSAQQAILIGVL